MDTILSGLDHLAAWLQRNDLGLALVFLVGLSISLSHAFALLANRLTPRQIAVQLMLDGLVLSVALLLNLCINILLISLCGPPSVHAGSLVDVLAPSLLPGAFYVFTAAPYISDLIAISIWGLIHLNVICLLHASFAMPYGQALLLSTPGYVLALLVVASLLHQSWRSAYRRLVSELET